MTDVGLLVLASLSDGPKHGYAIELDIESFAHMRLVPGALFRTINQLTRDGAIEVVPGFERRRPYKLTAAGRAQLEHRLELLQRIVTRTAT